MNNEHKYEYEKLIEQWGSYGAIREGLEYDRAVSFLIKVLSNNEIEVITGTSKVNASRIKHGKKEIDREIGNRLYQFYLDIAPMPVDQSDIPDEKLIPLYNRKDVIWCIDQLKNARQQTDTIIGNAFRLVQSQLRSMRDQTPVDTDKNSQELNDETHEKEQASKEKKEQVNKVQIDQVKNANGDVYLTDDHQNFYLKPNEKLEETMKRLGYVKKYAQEFSKLTLHQRYLLEFATLAKHLPVDDHSNYTIDELKKIYTPSVFWKLHAILGGNDNQDLRDKLKNYNVSLSRPVFNDIKDVVDWTNSLDEWLQKHPKFKDSYNNHSAQKHNINE